ncbi:MAG: hypothetical protein HC846_13330 [Blastocatellia bacterium]|nr:hypothetical protein [Blastocatellia bacterium]
MGYGVFNVFARHFRDFAYYDKAEKKGKKISNQQFNNEYVISKIKEIEQYHSSALHWNLMN